MVSVNAFTEGNKVYLANESNTNVLVSVPWTELEADEGIGDVVVIDGRRCMFVVSVLERLRVE